MSKASATGDDLILTGDITAAVVVELRERLRQQLSAASDCVIHAAEVTQLDTAGAQLLYAFVTERTRLGGSVHWASVSLYVMEAARMLGMTQHLGLTDEAS
jgi:anti-anti-sigma regulatory factor